MNYLSLLKDQNSWWENSSRIEELDLHLKRLSQSSINYIPSIMEEINFNSSDVYTLRGPRQIGKTTLVKIMIKKLLLQGVPADAITFFPLDLAAKAEEIIEIIRQVKDIFPDINSRRYFFFDEISSVPSWQRAIKYLRDTNLGNQDFFLLTGSSSRDIHKGMERLPGRRGSGTDKILMPLSFKEFVKFNSHLNLPPFKLDLREINPEQEKEIKKAMLHLTELNNSLQKYCFIGGFPSAVSSYKAQASLDPLFLQALWASLAGDIDRWERSSSQAIKLLERAQKSLGTPLSWNKVANEIGIASARTAEEYAEILAEEFSLLLIYFYDLSKQSFAPKKGKKIYFGDPLFYILPSFLSSSKIIPPDETTLPPLIENIAAVNLFLRYEREIVEAFPFPQSIFYWRSSSQKEVDFLVKIDNNFIPIEVKYQNQITGRDMLTMKTVFKKGWFLSKEILDLSGPIKIIPAALFLWLH